MPFLMHDITTRGLRANPLPRPFGAPRLPTLMSFTSFTAFASFAAAVLFSFPREAQAGVTNPDISDLGQVISGYCDDESSSSADEVALRSGEMELLLEAYLNPYLKGWFTLAGGEDGLALEEGYASLVKGLPWGLSMKAGKYRLGFGKVNPTHPHAFPFIDPPRSLVSLLPGGEEGFNETALPGTRGPGNGRDPGDIRRDRSRHRPQTRRFRGLRGLSPSHPLERRPAL